MAPASFWAEKPPDMLRLWFAFSARTQLLVVLADVEIIDYPRVELSEKLRLLMKRFVRRGEERTGAAPKHSGVGCSCWGSGCLGPSLELHGLMLSSGCCSGVQGRRAADLYQVALRAPRGLLSWVLRDLSCV